MKSHITIKDVAKYANVSVSTVSNVLNKVNKASDDTRSKVMNAIKELDYQPNLAARSLVKQKSKLIGVIFSVCDGLVNTYKTFMTNNPFYSEYLSSIEYNARNNGYDVLIAGMENVEDCRNWILKRNIDGIIIIGKCSNDMLKEFERMQIPIVFTDSYVQHNQKQGSIGIDDELGGYIATKYLIDLGHRNISLGADYIDYLYSVNYFRYLGYKRALKEADISFNNKIIFEGSTSYSGGFEIGKKIINNDEKITAIVTFADVVAVGIIKYLKEAGKDIPGDYSIIGFDNLTICDYISPSLTTINQDIFLKGSMAIEQLIKVIETEESFQERVQIPIKLIVRKSTRKLSI